MRLRPIRAEHQARVQRGETFALNAKAMSDKETLAWTPDRFRKAIGVLLSAGYIKQVEGTQTRPGREAVHAGASPPECLGLHVLRDQLVARSQAIPTGGAWVGLKRALPTLGSATAAAVPRREELFILAPSPRHSMPQGLSPRWPWIELGAMPIVATATTGRPWHRPQGGTDGLRSGV